MYVLSELKTFTLAALFSTYASQISQDITTQINKTTTLESAVDVRTCTVFYRWQDEPLRTWQIAYNNMLKTKNASKFGLPMDSRISETKGGVMVITPDEKCYIIKQHVLL